MKNTNSNKPKALFSGTIFDGMVDCYVLDDGRSVLSQRGIVRAITAKSEPGNALKKTGENTGRNRGDLGQYLERLPGDFSRLAAATSFEFTTPDGKTAIGREASFFSEFLDAYVDAHIAGQLHPSQSHLARNARILQKALGKVAIEALVHEATGYQYHRETDALAKRLALFIREQKAEHKVTFKEKLTRVLCELYGYPFDGRQPGFLGSVYSKLYKILTTEEVASELKLRNPAPSKGSNHHQLLTDTVRPMFEQDLEIVHAIALGSRNPEDFWSRVEWHFKKKPFQTGF